MYAKTIKRILAAALTLIMISTTGYCYAESYETKEICMGEFIIIIHEHGIEYKIIDPIWTMDEVDALAKLVWAEARGVKSTMEQAAVIWCVLNRVDNGNYGKTIMDVITAKNQFAYNTSSPIKNDFKILALDVLQRWWDEGHGAEDVGRVLPKEYCYFGANKKGTANVFRDKYNIYKSNYWDWSLKNPYK